MTQGHNEVRDALETSRSEGCTGDIAAFSYREVTKKPIVRESDEVRTLPASVADLRARGVWQPKLRRCLFTMFVSYIDNDAQSHVQQSVDVILTLVERLREKRRYKQQ